ncbi:MAG: hypothetical protein AAGH43_04645 [Pseudomonadota bacterium]
MSVTRFHHHLRGVLVALALCALAAQQLVGFALAASPALAQESGLSLCLSTAAEPGSPDGDTAPGLCVCTLQHSVAVWSPVLGPAEPQTVALFAAMRPAIQAPLRDPATLPPPSRAPPNIFHIA